MSPVVCLGAEEAASGFTGTSSLVVCPADLLMMANAAAVGVVAALTHDSLQRWKVRSFVVYLLPF